MLLDGISFVRFGAWKTSVKSSNENNRIAFNVVLPSWPDYAAKLTFCWLMRQQSATYHACSAVDQMTRDEALHLLKQTGERLQLRCWLRYEFDFGCTPLMIEKRELYQIGENELHMPIVVDRSGRIYVGYLDRIHLINSSFPQMLKAFEFANDWPIPDDLPDDQRASLFRQGLLEIDSECLKEPSEANGFWASCVQEIEQGVV